MEKDREAGAPPVRLAFRFGYLGDRFGGSQVQAEERTVEGEFIAACIRCELFTDFREARFQTGGRTDRGVHARGQVAAFTTHAPDRAIKALNWQLPPDIWVNGYAEVEPPFNPRYAARSRTYRYYFPPRGLDLHSMADAAQIFLGTHDFSAFARIQGKDPRRTVHSIRVAAEDGLAFIEVRGESFLWHMVRYMAASLLLAGQARISRDDIARHLETGEKCCHTPAPAFGLVLWDVDCGIVFAPIPPDSRTERHLGQLRDRHAVMERICSVFEESIG
ncbi:tRNA pseudouridine38-40 synthase [Methanolinea mesophila]|uniref:tRNA pseudouridine(38-40) synthase TruA n=1 Tax=Methanolinea mesophila TaxID=547055 RepID=UPI001AE2C9CC|nr:tRNA pseudouridine(38-40) synthase TruA [Methanolinea mesophila]MBP1928660.1 tRNA pseudouridine38-40 synthase [Methanolinea mesophila]